MSRLTIVEGNTNDKDNVRAIMVKGEKGDKGDNGEITYSDVVDNLTSTETQKPLSANQGKELKELIDSNKENVDNDMDKRFKEEKITSTYLENVCALEYRPTGSTKGLQGGCYAGDGNVICYFTSDNKIQVISLSTGEVVREATFSILNHGNGMVKIDNYIYVCGTGDVNNNVYKIPYDTLGSIEVVNVLGENKIPSGTNISCIAYNPDDEKVYITSAPVFPTLTIYEFNKNLTTLLNTYTLDNEDEYGGFITNICYWNSHLLVNYNYGKLQLFNVENMSLFKTINLNLNVGSRYASEIEWLDSYENNELIVGCVGFIGDGYGNGNIFFAKTDLKESSRSYPIGVSKASTSNKYPKNYYVYVDNTQETIDVTRDGSSEKPFNNLYEASQVALLDNLGVIIIYLKGDYSNEGLYICNTNNIVKVVNLEENTSVNVREVYIANVEKVRLRNIITDGEFYAENTHIDVTYSTSSITTELNLNAQDTARLTFNTTNKQVSFTGGCSGILEFTKLNDITGLVGVKNSDNTFTTPLYCRNIQNAKTRCRLDGSAYTASSTFDFNVPICKHSVWIQVASKYYALPIAGVQKTYTMSLDDGITLSVTITIADNLCKYNLSVDNSAIIYDAYCIF